MIKAAKFGGSSLADAAQFQKVKRIVESDPTRTVVVVSAPGKRNKDDHKITDLLYLCHAHLKYGVSYESIFSMVEERYRAIKEGCGIALDLDAEFIALKNQMNKEISIDYLVSRGEYLAAKL
ncbi:MAG TPA: aspartate kinase, partial [Clostridia bacterium]|nr:aspartate kinase [Clostridia bacterium]